MAIIVCPVTPNFAAEIGDVDLSRPLEATDVTAIKEAFAKYSVLAFPDQHLSQDEHLDFARHFGPLETTMAAIRKDAKLRLRAEFADVSNLGPDTEVWGSDSRERMFKLGDRLWHTDSAFKRRWHRYSTRARSRRSAATPSLPTSALPTTRFPKR
jgi:alpha-ketoglutarate-dependent 2,4-dichlorophenoxyacetate dioxygenase